MDPCVLPYQEVHRCVNDFGKRRSGWYSYQQGRTCIRRQAVESAARSRNHCCSGKAISITRSECVFVALVIHHAKSMRRIISPSVACPALPYFFHIVTNATIFGRKLLSIKCEF